MRLEQVLAAARARRAALTVETAGYIALGVADALAVSPGVVRETDVVLDAEGNVTVSGAARSEDAHAAERSVRTMLQKLLSVCAGASPALSACARRTAGAGMRPLVEELEAALIPVNRSAARRSIGRLAREASKAGPLPSEPPRPSPRAPHRDVAPGPVPRMESEPEPELEPAPAPEPAKSAESVADRASDVFAAATEPDFTARPAPAIAPPIAPSIHIQDQVETTPTELTSTVEVEAQTDLTVPLEIVPIPPTPPPAYAALSEDAPPVVPDLEVGSVARRPPPMTISESLFVANTS
ncbi:MAG TPA: hypothetical protein PLI95_24880, partial [Polyangiaceae bacterium]|nr:hypothetical protein [Polyangiaceae bacterium]